MSHYITLYSYRGEFLRIKFFYQNNISIISNKSSDLSEIRISFGKHLITLAEKGYKGVEPIFMISNQNV